MSTGKRAGSRRAPEAKSSRKALALHALGITATVIAWGYLAWLAVDFGAQARGGEKLAWAFLALATVGAIACLFVGLILGASVLRLLHVTTPEGDDEEAAPRPVGGRRRA